MNMYMYTPGADLEDLVVGHVGSQSCEGLSAAAAHAHQQGVATGLLHYTADATHVLYGKPAASAYTLLQ